VKTLTVLMLLATSPALASDKAVKERWSVIEQKFVEQRNRLKTNCGGNVPDFIDRRSFGTDLDRPVGPLACYRLVEAVANICTGKEDPAFNKSVLKRIKKISCRYGGPLPKEVKEQMKTAAKPYEVPGSQLEVSLSKKGVFQWVQHYDPDTEYLVFSRGDHFSEELNAFLKKEL